jgi:hypothetical protein
MNVISLPENKQQMEEMYKNIFQNINLNNTLNGVSLLQEITSEKVENENMIQYDKIEMPTKGIVNSKVLPIKHKTIGLDLKNTIDDTQIKSEEDPEAIKKQDKKEINKRLHENFPRYRNLRFHEKSDLEEKTIKEEKQKIEFENNKEKNFKGFSFMQKQHKEDRESYEDNQKINSINNIDLLVSSNLPKNGVKMSK